MAHVKTRSCDRQHVTAAKTFGTVKGLIDYTVAKLFHSNITSAQKHRTAKKHNTLYKVLA